MYKLIHCTAYGTFKHCTSIKNNNLKWIFLKLLQSWYPSDYIFAFWGLSDKLVLCFKFVSCLVEKTRGLEYGVNWQAERLSAKSGCPTSGVKHSKVQSTENLNFFWLFTWSLAMSASKNISYYAYILWYHATGPTVSLSSGSNGP